MIARCFPEGTLAAEGAHYRYHCKFFLLPAHDKFILFKGRAALRRFSKATDTERACIHTQKSRSISVAARRHDAEP